MTYRQHPHQQSAALHKLVTEDAVGLLRGRAGKMAVLGSEDGKLKLDWVEGIARLLADPDGLEAVENEARALWEQGIRHIIWAGMGGSIMAVRVLKQMGFGDASAETGITIYPLDSTDPAALNTILQQIAQAKQQPLTASNSELKTLLEDVMMVGVAMGMTSEEPITHLTWFTQLLEQAGLSPAAHLLVMTLPDSYLDRFARAQHAPSRPLQLDGGTGTGGRMSAPATRVFLLPAALYLSRQGPTAGKLRQVLSKAWNDHNLEQAMTQPARHPFVQLAAALADTSSAGACRLLLNAPAPWDTLFSWIEQLMEESLGKGKQGVVIFQDQELNAQAADFQHTGTLRVVLSADTQPVTTTTHEELPSFMLHQPYLASTNPLDRLAAVATCFLGWQLSMALYGYLQDITFAGQPAVEAYKAGARSLRNLPDPLQPLYSWPVTFSEGSLKLYAPLNVIEQATPAAVLASTLKRVRPAYLDCTINGEVFPELKDALAQIVFPLANRLLGIPAKLRQAPADYHSTEQSEMDGPPDLVSLRILFHQHEHIQLGTYSDTFLLAQAVSTWQAMIGQNRQCFLLVIDGSAQQAASQLTGYLRGVVQELRS
ncbi:hypothetical protein [Dictyobacter arantiisoli]|uniref:Glucose-6-phosphate isomerase n=1 Tax=Dictyobacter arantiisoli TaxID=2014874 RepID=A0A5A5T7Y8_9CHLR|nr:hypothetical protein [Dictyobacter arantiisoli]GCF07571.1 hypothetical protein KDI_11350 [Dictyobacter arantiisoli]